MKLQGLRVVDLSVFLPGPYLTLAMADHGAEVIKVEQPGEGDPGRHIGLSDGPHTVFFRNLNRGKKSVVLDLKSREGLDALMRLVDEADVFVEAFRPGVAKRLGIDYDTLHARNPRLVYCSISAFGQDGPYRDRPAHEIATEALGGALGLGLGRDGTPTMPGLPWVDLLAGVQGLSGVLMALLRRVTTGVGDFVDISMLDTAVGSLVQALGPTIAEGRQPIPSHERSTGGAAFYHLYQTADGRHLALAGQEPKFINNLLGALGRPDLAPLCLRGPGVHQAPVIEFLEETFLQRTRAEWDAFLGKLDVCYGHVNTLPETLADPQVNARGMVLRDDEGRPHLGPPIRFRREPATPVLQAPKLGEHHDLVSPSRNRT
jgi:crotonobetainyl-CoA:carnitine CoA-transferase CaiB-like acyl-CoA transferase